LRRALGLVGFRRRQPGAQAGGKPRRVPDEQFAQCRIVAAGQGRDQVVVVHHLIYCTHGDGGSRLSVNFRSGARFAC
jgi:hypothetical protein